jgi:hypothetical protein
MFYAQPVPGTWDYHQFFRFTGPFKKLAGVVYGHQVVFITVNQQ